MKYLWDKKKLTSAIFIQVLLIITLLAFWPHGATADTIRVPLDHSTIQNAIDSAINGDTVLVEPGIYIENINFGGKAITVASEQGPKNTIIDGNQTDSVVTFSSEEGNTSILSGFTLQNGKADFGGGGISIMGSSPTISDNIITNNKASNGLGIEIYFGSPIIQGNTIKNNSRDGSSGGTGGGGICILGNGSAQILNNIIIDNVMDSADGGGISLFAAGTPKIQGNTISGNTVSGMGGGISLVNSSDALIIQNVITNNSAGGGGGVSWLVPSGNVGPFLVNNTIVNNDSPMGSGIFADGYDAQTLLVNNIVIAKEGQSAIYCGDFNDINPPIFEFNNVYSSQGKAYDGICIDPTGTNGNISLDPIFVAAKRGDYHLMSSSFSIDAGDNDAPYLPATDFDGYERIWGASIDIGSYEFIDDDHDGLQNYLEDKICTDPFDADTDNDGILDGDEDCDGDRFTNLEEVKCGSDPGDLNSRCSINLPFLMLLLD